MLAGKPVTMLLHGLAVAFACMIGAGATEGNHGLHFADAMAHARLPTNKPAPIREMRFRQVPGCT